MKNVLLFLHLLLHFVSLGEAGSLRGIVRDTQTRGPVAGAFVVLTPDASDSDVQDRNATTTPIGLYKFLDLPASSYDVMVTAEGYDTQIIPNVTIGSGEGEVATLDVLLDEVLKMAGGIRLVLTWAGLAYDLDSQILSSCGCWVNYDRPVCIFQDHPLQKIQLLADSKYGDRMEEIILSNITCGVYDYFITIYSKGYSFDDAEPHIAIYNDSSHGGELITDGTVTEKKPIAEFEPSEVWANVTQTSWWAVRIIVNQEGEIHIEEKEVLEDPQIPEDKCHVSIPCMNAASTLLSGVNVFALALVFLFVYL